MNNNRQVFGERMTRRRKIAIGLTAGGVALGILAVVLVSAASVRWGILVDIPAFLLVAAGVLVARERPYVIPPDDDE
jgi:peptidoglycan/LPS O-acetylase OafA/YrhL